MIRNRNLSRRVRAMGGSGDPITALGPAIDLKGPESRWYQDFTGPTTPWATTGDPTGHWKGAVGSASATSNGTRPAGISSEINGLPALAGDGINDFLVTTWIPSTPCHIFMVCKRANYANGMRYFAANAGAGDSFSLTSSFFDTTVTVAGPGGFISDAALSPFFGDVEVWEIRFTGSQTYARCNALTAGTGTGSAGAATAAMRLMSDSGGTSNYPLSIGRFTAFGRNLTAGEVTVCRDRLELDWGEAL